MSFTFEGESGMHTMKDIMERLRTNAPKEAAGILVTKVVDYAAEGTGLPKADVLEFRLGDTAKLMVRPSGTEPKMKIYLSAVGKSEQEADDLLAALENEAGAWMKS